MSLQNETNNNNRNEAETSGKLSFLNTFRGIDNEENNNTTTTAADKNKPTRKLYGKYGYECKYLKYIFR